MKGEQMKRVGMLANARFDGDTEPETVQDPTPDNPEPETPDPIEEIPTQTPEQPGDGDFELVKDKPAKCAAGLHRFIRPVLLAVAVFVAYKLFFAKRR